MRIPKILFIGWLMTVLLTACKDDEKEYVDRFYHYTFENEDITVDGKEQTVNLTITAEIRAIHGKAHGGCANLKLPTVQATQSKLRNPPRI